MDESDELLTLFSAEVERRDGTPVVDVPEQEVELGDLSVDEPYRIAILPRSTTAEPNGDEPSERTQHAQQSAGPPVEEGELCEVEIEDVGEQGDGLARIGPGYIVFVPGTAIGDRVTVEIRTARANFAFGDVVEDEPISR